jgi:hypothetical protein
MIANRLIPAQVVVGGHLVINSVVSVPQFSPGPTERNTESAVPAQDTGYRIQDT